MNQFRLEGRIDTRDEEIADLREQVRQLSIELDTARAKHLVIESGLRGFRQATLPLLTALQQTHGLIEKMGVQEGAGEGTNGAGASSKWDAIKQRNPGRIAQAIDVMLLHGPITNSQLSVALKMNRTNCGNNVTGKLLRMGLAVRNGNEITLKQI